MRKNEKYISNPSLIPSPNPYNFFFFSKFSLLSQSPSPKPTSPFMNHSPVATILLLFSSRFSPHLWLRKPTPRPTTSVGKPNRSYTLRFSDRFHSMETDEIG